MMITNGRVCGDMCGNYTCMQYNGCSLVDVVITGSGLFNRINYLKVFAFDWYSDYAVVSSSWWVDIKLTTDIPNSWQKLVKLFKNWDNDTKQQLLYKISSPEISSRLNELCNTDFHSSHPATRELTCTSILNNVLKSIFRNRVKSKSQARNSQKRGVISIIEKFKWQNEYSNKLKELLPITQIIWTDDKIIFQKKTF